MDRNDKNNEEEIGDQKGYRPPEGLIITPSGMRGRIGDTLTLEPVIRFTKSFGIWLGTGKRVLVGRDTRSTGIMLRNAISASLNSSGVDVYDVDVCPTPVILYYLRKHNFDGAAIVTGSHNPPDYNGVKYLSKTFTFLGHDELNSINQYFLSSDPLPDRTWREIGNYNILRINQEYINDIQNYVNKDIIEQADLKVVIDPGAGAGTGVTDRILRKLGCEVKVVNAEFANYPEFPRAIEPVSDNLHKLSDTVKGIGADIGFAHDCDADRVAIVGKNGKIYPEDTTVALLIKYILETETDEEERMKNPPIIVTNSASSLIVEEIARLYNADVIRTPVGERHLAMKMYELIERFPDRLVFGGEGSSGGFMYPNFNNARDGIYAAAKMCEILAHYGQSLKELLQNLPKFYSVRNNIRLATSDARTILNRLKGSLESEGTVYSIIDRDIKILDEESHEWTLIHPSNTEPVLRIITEAKSEERAQALCDKMSRKIGEIG